LIQRGRILYPISNAKNIASPMYAHAETFDVLYGWGSNTCEWD